MEFYYDKNNYDRGTMIRLMVEAIIASDPSKNGYVYFGSKDLISLSLDTIMNLLPEYYGHEIEAFTRPTPDSNYIPTGIKIKGV